jgi:Xaa-Pro aminopeptidase
MTSPFARAELERRCERARALMHQHALDAMLLTSERNVEYFSGFASDLWASPTRPFYLVIPREGEPSAILPQGAESQWRRTAWVEQIESWPAPRPQDEGVTTVAAVLRRSGRRFGCVGLEMGPESRIGITLADALKLIDTLRPLAVGDCSELCRELRMIKSAAEIARLRAVGRIASASFARLPGMVTPASTESDVARRFVADLCAGGADKVPFLAFASGPGGYDNILSRPTERALARGDVLAIDTGATVGGYFCDFDRNLSVGPAPAPAAQAYVVLHRATAAGIEAARPGATAADVFHAQAKVIDAMGARRATMGRFGHGLGMSLTEWPSNKPDDLTPLRPGIVLTIEPGVDFGDGKVMVHEENVVITEDGCELLSVRAAPELPEVPW